MVINTVISGVAEAPQGRTHWASALDLEDALLRAAADDANVDIANLDAIISVPPRAGAFLVDAAAIAERLGISPRHVFSVEAGGTAPITMLALGRALIRAGEATHVAVVAADLPLTGVGRAAYVAGLANAGGPVHPVIEAPFGPTAPTLFALMASRHVHAFGTNEGHLASVALQDRRLAAAHPNAHMTAALALEDYLASRPISSPLRLLDCAPVSDGGGAVILSARGTARSGNPVAVRATAQSTSHLHLSAAPSLTRFDVRPMVNAAIAAAGTSRHELSAAFIYDCFTIAMLLALEGLGFAEPGEAGPMFVDGQFDVDGALPVNTHGGLLSHGHPGRAGGMSNLIEAVHQVRGDATGRQLAECHTVLVHGMTGAFAQQAVAIIGE